MRSLGNLRDYWEGGYRGEGILRQIKSLVTQGTHQPWFATCALRKFYEKKTMSMIINGDFFDDSDNDSNETQDTKKYSNTYRYSSKDCLQKLIINGRPIAGIRLDSDVVCCAVGWNKVIEYYEILFDDNSSKCCNATYYCLLKLGAMIAAETTNSETSDVLNRICDYVVMLPHLDHEIGVTSDGEDDCSRYYYVVDSSWKERGNMNGVVGYSLPIVEHAIY